MYKKIIPALVLFSFIPLAAFSQEEDPSRLRLYTPVATSATVTGCSTCSVAAAGYSVHYVFGIGLGLGVTSSKATITNSAASGSYYYDAGQMIDISYSFGSSFTFTLGMGTGSSNDSDAFGSNEYSATGSTNLFVGFGYDFGGFEVLIGNRTVSSTHTYKLLGSDIPWDVSRATTDIGVGFTF